LKIQQSSMPLQPLEMGQNPAPALGSEGIMWMG
jgi:hypothetical protein